jgi:lipoate-protein ligase A
VDDFELKEWYFWSCEAYSGTFNMATDHFLAHQMYKKLDKPLLRFYTWNPYCISLGYHQNHHEIDKTACWERGIDIVRRPTGGRAILHAEELTYSIIYPIEKMKTNAFYRLVHLPFVESLNNLGIPAEFESVQPDFIKVYNTERAPLCFATSAKYEVEVEGKKLIGSAQRIYEKAILQHGSLLIGPEHENLVEFLKISERQRARMKKYIRDHTSYIWQYNPNTRALSLSEQIKAQFIKIFHIAFINIDLNPSLRKALEDQKRDENFKISLN